MIQIITKILISLLTEKLIIGILLGFGDWLIPRTSNALDDKIWNNVRKVLTHKDTPEKPIEWDGTGF